MSLVNQAIQLLDWIELDWTNYWKIPIGNERLEVTMAHR